MQDIIGHPWEQKYKDMVINKTLPNWTVTVKYITNEIYTFGPDLSSVIDNKGRLMQERWIHRDMWQYL